MLERRATYLALVHDQYLVDMLTEEDVAAGRLKDYDVLYTVDPNISARATTAIKQWVRDGGYLFGACGAGSRDEFNEPGPGLAAVFGIEVYRGAGLPGAPGTRLRLGGGIHDPSEPQRHHFARILTGAG